MTLECADFRAVLLMHLFHNLECLYFFLEQFLQFFVAFFQIAHLGVFVEEDSYFGFKLWIYFECGGVVLGHYLNYKFDRRIIKLKTLLDWLVPSSLMMESDLLELPTSV